MARLRTLQATFTTGEVDPRLTSRTDWSKYFAGGRRMRNVIVMPAGGFRRRPGTRHILTVPDGAEGVRLADFAFNVSQTYLCVCTHGALRVLRDGVQTAHVSGLPWTAGQVREFNWVQAADTMLVAHRDVRPCRITRQGSDSNWSWAGIGFANVPQHDYGDGAEDVISDARGWPECLTFYQGRLYLAGFRSRPSTVIASVAGDFFNLDEGAGLDDRAIYFTIDTDQINAVHQIVSGRKLQIFTAGSEHAIVAQPPITPKNLAIEEQTRRGIKRFCRVTEVDGATLFIQKGGAALREFLYDDVQQAFGAENLSLLAPHLIRDPLRIVARKGARADDSDFVLVVNADGTMAVLQTLRSQEIAAFTLWETQGRFLDVAVLADGTVWLAVERAGTVRIEMLDDTALMDASVIRSTGLPAEGLGGMDGLSHLNGFTVQAVADGAVQPEAVAAGGYVPFAVAAKNSAQAGLGFPVEVDSLPIDGRLPDGTMVGRMARIARVNLRVQDSGPFTVNGQQAVLREFAGGLALDAPPPRVTGDVSVEGLLGWSRQATVCIRQTLPQPLTVLSLSAVVGV